MFELVPADGLVERDRLAADPAGPLQDGEACSEMLLLGGGDVGCEQVDMEQLHSPSDA